MHSYTDNRLRGTHTKNDTSAALRSNLMLKQYDSCHLPFPGKPKDEFSHPNLLDTAASAAVTGGLAAPTKGYQKWGCGVPMTSHIVRQAGQHGAKFRSTGSQGQQSSHSHRVWSTGGKGKAKGKRWCQCSPSASPFTTPGNVLAVPAERGRDEESA